MSSSAAVNRPSTAARSRLAGLLVIAGGAVGIPVGVATATVLPSLAQPGSSGFVAGGAILSAAHLAMLAGFVLLALAGSGARGRLAQLGFAVTIAGLAAQFLGESLLRVDFSLGMTLFSICTPALGLGLIVLGAAIVRSRRWTGWRRFAVLATGLYVPVILVPAFALAHGPSFLALAVWSAFFTAAGVAAWQEAAS